jgi:hypothetical protein
MMVCLYSLQSGPSTLHAQLHWIIDIKADVIRQQCQVAKNLAAVMRSRSALPQHTSSFRQLHSTIALLTGCGSGEGSPSELPAVGTWLVHIHIHTCRDRQDAQQHYVLDVPQCMVSCVVQGGATRGCKGFKSV